MTPPSSQIIAPDRLLSVQEAGAALLSPLSHYSYITVTDAYKDQDNTLNTHKDKKGRVQKTEKRGEVRGE